jgi:alanyl-tRNA synthetase
MKSLTVNELREAFLSFFEERGHQRIPSASLIPHGDPTLLFTSAGMVQFKPYFTGAAEPPSPRMTTVQKCFRTTDIEDVGDASHLTMFEMLGNFSIGDYFKQEAIEWAWEFLTETLEIDGDKLWITVFTTDDEAAEIWEGIGVPTERIFRYTAEQGNFWPAPPVPVGPCGPCSEVHFDFGETPGCKHCGDGTCHPDIECGRFLEIWNIVFTMLYQDDDGEQTPLPANNVDTGAGLERIAWVLRSGNSVYDTDELRGVIARVEELSDQPYDIDQAPQVAAAMRAISDHARALAFLISDGVLPSNEGRGYVLRRVLRRAIYFGYTIGMRDSYMDRVADAAVDQALQWYPEIEEQRDFIRRVISVEEARFQATLSRGLDLLDEVIERESDGKQVPGRDMFTLYDTHGLPPELTLEVAAARGYSVDQQGFDAEMEAQRVRSRGEAATFDLDNEERVQRFAALGVTSDFLGYDALTSESTLTAIVADGGVVDRLASGEAGEIALAATTFYAESGGQVGDHGEIVTPNGRFRVDDTQLYGEAIVHSGEVVEGEIATGETAETRVDPDYRTASARNHTATHLLHAALRSVLGSHVRQAGSYVGPDRLRFDYTHPEAPGAEALREVQRLVNARIRDDIIQQTEELPYEEAIERGAIAFFEDRYSTNVRVVEYCETRGHSHAPGECFSRELCGGTHLQSTGQVGSLQLVADSSIGAGLRRIEAVTGPEAEAYVEQRLDALDALSQRFKVPALEVSARVDAIEQQLAAERKRAEGFERKASISSAGELSSQAEEIDGVHVLVARVDASSAGGLRALADQLRASLGTAFIALGAESEGRPMLLIAATDDVVERGLHADEIIREVAAVVGGGGGGRPQLAQAGGKDATKIDDALAVALAAAKERLG